LKVTVKAERPGSSKPVPGPSRRRFTPYLVCSPMSRWARSRAKRFFDLVVVIAALPVAAPLCLLIAIVIRINSRGPAFFLQKRIGRHGKPFSIVKFRTMRHSDSCAANSITTIDNERITSAGRILRYWKLDELPQLLNVLRGEMSLVGPRPRVPEQQRGEIQCRPGITGAASLAFAREEVLLATIPKHHLDTYYANRVIPLKQRLDDAYMARATFPSDLRLLFLTAFRVWVAAAESEPAEDLSSDRFRETGAVAPGESGD
jgi:lipopolysaccharide/colanic/teichoic acid biosynthesis glycosyltransferase